MCYLVAKKKSQSGCVALRTEHSQRLVEFKRELNAVVKGSGVQLVTISNPTAYGEYEPYVYAQDEEEFISMVKDMTEIITAY